MRLRHEDEEVPLVLGSRMSRVICPFPPVCIHGMYRDNFAVFRVEKGRCKGNLVIVPFPSELWNMLQENV
jgi:hypothetical protein